MECRYFRAGECRSCSLIETPYAQQLREKEAWCRDLLRAVPETAWLPSFSGGDRGFRNRVKLAVGGDAGAVTLGILGPGGRGIDLRDCLIQAPEIAAVLPALTETLNDTQLAPYNLQTRKGELKYAHITVSPAGKMMLRFVVRTQHGLDVLRSRLAPVRRAVPAAEVITVNLLPEHKAVLEGEREEVLLGESLAMDLGPVTLHLQPKSFFQTNTAVARELYAQVATWVGTLAPASVWDLYCGVGGFALHCSAELSHVAESNQIAEQVSARHEVVGVEISAEAIAAAERSARNAGLATEFVVGDATEFALRATAVPDLVIVNPPRRGIGSALATWLEESGPQHVVYSSCNPVTLASDLAAMPSFAVREARVFDMFPHTAHLEVAVRLERV